MHVTEVVQFLQQIPPFSQLPAFEQQQISSQLKVYYASSEEQLGFSHHLLLVRTGLFFSDDQQQLHPLQSGDFWGYAQLLTQDDLKARLRCQEDGLVYSLPEAQFNELRRQYKNFDLFFQRLLSRSLHLHQSSQNSALRVADLCSGRKVSITPNATIQQAAQLMTNERVSSLLVEADDELVGILTDRDLRSRVIAKGLDPTLTVKEIMTPRPFRISGDHFAFEAMQLMSQHNIHHLPVEINHKIVGLISTSDLIRSSQEHPLFVISHIHRQHDRAGLADCQQSIRQLIAQLFKQHMPVAEVSRILAGINDALAQSWIRLAEQELGPPPCMYTWLCFGSQARQDMLPSADQDNALLLEKEPVDDIERYFSQFAKIVCEGLASSGQVLCPGNVMATNPQLRLSLKGWSQRFAAMLNTPDPQGLLDSTIYFDCRYIAGSQGLMNALHQDILARAQNQGLFLYHLAKNALSHQPPLGFFKHFLLEHDGQQRRGLDLKKRGSSLINDLVRVHALAHGIAAVSTRERIELLKQKQVLSAEQAQNLLAAYEVLAELRWQLQGEAFIHHASISNLLDPASLDLMKRHQLKDAFALISEEQKVLQLRYCREV